MDGRSGSPAAPAPARARAFLRRLRPLAAPAALFAAAAALVVAVTWPLALHADGGLIRHWDPPFHAWKLEFMARRILAGDPFFLNRETTLLYPHAGTLYFEALQWPASLLGALFFAATDWSPELVYHVVLLAMWSLSAPCAFLFLRALGVRPAAAAAASLAFCVLPYRVSYVNELQMQFAFGTPLVLLALHRFFERPGALRGAAVSLALWFYAVTELNQAVFCVFLFPFLAAAHLARDPRLPLRRGFAAGALAAAAAGLALLPVLLWPYAQQHAAGAVVRDLAEVNRHSVHVLSFLKPFGRSRPWDFEAKTEEWQAYPGLALALLAAAGAAALCCASLRDRRAPAWRRLAPLPPLAGTAAFLALSVLFRCAPALARPKPLLIWSALPCACAAAALLACFGAGGASPRRRTLVGLAAGAVLCAFLSNGPFLAVDVPGARGVSAPNALYLALYRHGPFLAGFRAACRFGVLVHFAMVALAALALDRLAARFPARRRRVAASLSGAAFLAAVALEGIPPPQAVATAPSDRPDDWPVPARLARRPRPFTLAVFPMGDRMRDGRTMFTLLKDRYDSFYAWCGYVPPDAEAVRRAADRGDYAAVCAALRELWPDCLLLADSAQPVRPGPGYAEAHPDHVVLRGGAPAVDHAAALAPFASVADADGRFTLLSLDRGQVAEKFAKRFRSDYGRRFPEAVFRVDPLGATAAAVSVCGGPPERFALEPGRPAEIRAAVPRERLAVSGGNRIEISFDAPARLTGFELRKPAADRSAALRLEQVEEIEHEARKAPGVARGAVDDVVAVE